MSTKLSKKYELICNYGFRFVQFRTLQFLISDVQWNQGIFSLILFILGHIALVGYGPPCTCFHTCPHMSCVLAHPCTPQQTGFKPLRACWDLRTDEEAGLSAGKSVFFSPIITTKNAITLGFTHHFGLLLFFFFIPYAKHIELLGLLLAWWNLMYFSATTKCTMYMQNSLALFYGYS